MLRSIPLLILIAGAPAPAMPTDSRAATRVTIEWKHGAKEKLVADDSLWRCTGSTCTGRVVDRARSRLRACRQLARAGGRIVSFETASGALSSNELAACNDVLQR
ncbi:CC_3452 family protein [Sphingomonas sp.]|jgi:hypothetical protein|uniref:CC_3452 family protein n=1 Tax=Sphingomonas sp. TaxID=28214 RepID=UPI0039C8D6DC